MISKISGVISFNCEGIVNFDGAGKYKGNDNHLNAKGIWDRSDEEHPVKTPFISPQCIKRAMFKSTGMTGLKTHEQVLLGEVFNQSLYGVMVGARLGARSAFVLGRAYATDDTKTFVEQCSGANPNDNDKRDMPFTRDTAGKWSARSSFQIDLETLEVQEGKTFSVLEATVGGKVEIGKFRHSRLPEGVESQNKKGAKLSDEQMKKLILDTLVLVTKYEVMKNSGSVKTSGFNVVFTLDDGSEIQASSVEEVATVFRTNQIQSCHKKIESDEI